jgi:DNA replication protein DnaC
VCLFNDAELVADHPRCYQQRQVIEDWRHYVPLLLKKSFAVPWASALRHGDLPPTFEAARSRVSGSTCRWQSGVCPAPGAVSDPRGFDGRGRPGPSTRGIRGWSADAVRQLLNFASTPDVPVPPLDPSKSPAYQGMTPPPDLSAYNRLTSGAAMTDNMGHEMVTTYLKQLRLSRMARDCEPLGSFAEQRGLGYLGYLQALLEGELAQRQEQQLRQRLKAAAFPSQKRLEDFDFSLVPCLSKIRLLELAQGAFVAAHDNVLLIGPSGIGKTHLLLGLGRALCLAGYRVLFRSAVTLATELEVAHKELRLPRLLAQYRRFDLVLVDELGYLPFAKPTALPVLQRSL